MHEDEVRAAAYEAMDAERRGWQSRRAVTNVHLADLRRERDRQAAAIDRVREALNGEAVMVPVATIRGALAPRGDDTARGQRGVTGPDQRDVDKLRDLLDLMVNFPDNDQRARYLLCSNWMRDRRERVEAQRDAALHDLAEAEAERDQLAAALRAREASVEHWHDTYQQAANATDAFLTKLLELLPGAQDTGSDAYDQIPRGIEALKAERDAKLRRKAIGRALVEMCDFAGRETERAASWQAAAEAAHRDHDEVQAERDAARAEVERLRAAVRDLADEMRAQAASVLDRDPVEHGQSAGERYEAEVDEAVAGRILAVLDGEAREVRG